MTSSGTGGQNSLEDIITAVLSGNGDNTSEKIADQIAIILTQHSGPLVPFVERLWPRVDPYIWLYMFYTVLIVGSSCLGVTILLSFARRVYLATPPVKEWGPIIWTAIKEMRNKDALRGYLDE